MISTNSQTIKSLKKRLIYEVSREEYDFIKPPTKIDN